MVKEYEELLEADVFDPEREDWAPNPKFLDGVSILLHVPLDGSPCQLVRDMKASGCMNWSANLAWSNVGGINEHFRRLTGCMRHPLQSLQGDVYVIMDFYSKEKLREMLPFFRSLLTGVRVDKAKRNARFVKWIERTQ